MLFAGRTPRVARIIFIGAPVLLSEIKKHAARSQAESQRKKDAKVGGKGKAFEEKKPQIKIRHPQKIADDNHSVEADQEFSWNACEEVRGVVKEDF